MFPPLECVYLDHKRALLTTVSTLQIIEGWIYIMSPVIRLHFWWVDSTLLLVVSVSFDLFFNIKQTNMCLAYKMYQYI